MLSTIDSANHVVKIYDSLYNSIDEDILTVIACSPVKGKHMFPHKHPHNAHAWPNNMVIQNMGFML